MHGDKSNINSTCAAVKEARGKKTINREMRKKKSDNGKSFPFSMERNCAIIKFNVLCGESVVKFYKFSSLRNIKNLCIQHTVQVRLLCISIAHLLQHFCIHPLNIQPHFYICKNTNTIVEWDERKVSVSLAYKSRFGCRKSVWYKGHTIRKTKNFQSIS